MQPNTENSHTNGVKYERRDVNFRGAYIFAISLAVTLIIIIFAMRGLFAYYSEAQTLGPPPTPFKTVREIPPAPRLQPAPKQDLEHELEQQQQLLNSYGWVDQDAGKVRIPIDRAMDELLQRGLPTRPRTNSSQSQQMQEKGKK